MKVAHLVMVHKNPLQVERLVKELLKEDCDVYLHIDKKFATSPFDTILQKDRVFLVNQRVDVIWGGYSQVKATMVSVEQILQSGKTYDYIHFISGQDYPIKKLSDFYAFLQLHKGKEFLEYLHAEERAEVTRRRIYQYNLSDFRFKGRYLVQKILNLVLPEKKFPFPDYKIVWKANWFTITPSCARYVLTFLKENPKVERFFKYCWGVDEFVFQTIAYNSAFGPNIVNNNYRYVDWSANLPSPKTLTLEDYNALANSPHFFARKFDSNVDSAILDKIDANLLN